MLDKEPLNLNYGNLRFLTEYINNEGVFIAGGAFKNILSGEKVRDIDIYGVDSKSVDRELEFFNKDSERFSPRYHNDNVTAFYDNKNEVTLEVVTGFMARPEEIMEDFDFTIVKAYISAGRDENNELTFYVSFHEKFFEHLFMKRLVLDNGTPFPASTFNRMLKYAGYGYKPCYETKIEILHLINELTNVDEDELTKSLYAGFD